MSNINEEPAHAPELLVDQLLKGYESLMVEIKHLDEQRRELENKVSWSKQQYLDALKRFVPEQASQEFRSFLDELDEAGATQPEGHVDWLQSLQNSTDPVLKSRAYSIQCAADAREKIRFRQKSSDCENAVHIWNGRSADALESSGIEMERDFTTPGTPGRLYCPFVPPNKRDGFFNLPSASGHPRGISTPRSSISRTSGRRSKRSSFHDPIRAEMCGQGLSGPSAPPSVEGSAPLCPIRFLKQHSPEEIAKYFESHKHEVPRSHAVCVKRYQSNEQSVRQLDAKYGNLVNMIQGLGEKHQPLLPEVDDDAIVDEDGEVVPESRVQNWAKAVSVSMDDNVDQPQTAPMEDDDRLSHFDRPLKDVRVGESPSRPWGITVPERYAAKSGVISTRSDPTASPLETPRAPEPDTPAKGKCPFDHKNMKFDAAPSQPAVRDQPAPQPASQAQVPQQDVPRAQPSPPPQHEQKPSFSQPAVFAEDSISTKAGGVQMIFNGPVFFGYGMEQALALLQQGGMGSKQ
ncbi:hypothetical protein E2P81_ATG08363 [Venturia nashicola]|uniref:Uncharacterized protein n=1 Tax=Venturia nashicola TaxID=86259 RepID=A0A4Z1NI00_9PEZI|nr:hypothetical protein E6O75_ATG08552 [Venturia nashicola]TLD21775.1 hypothetical protein E2P81_ATG08363 [Venturia nashicola]